MYLEKSRRDKLYELLFYLLEYTNRKYKINTKVLGKLKVNKSINPMELIDIREKLWENNNILEEYIKSNPDKLAKEDLDIIESWKNRIQDNFLMIKHLKKHTIFFANNKFYGVVGISNEISEMIPEYALPVFVKTVLLPFDGKIVYDTFIMPYTIHLGGGIRATSKREYAEAKKEGKIIISLDNLNEEKKTKDDKGKSKETRKKFKCYEIKVAVRDTHPPVWRRLQIPSGITFHELSAIIQLAFNWSGYHLYNFEVGSVINGNGVYIELPDIENDFYETIDSAKEKIDYCFENYKKIKYTYDFGDNWIHDITIEKVIETDLKLKKPICIKAKMADLPEDCGGAWVYQSYLEDTMEEEEKEEFEEWLGEEFSITSDRTRVDIEEINERLSDYKERAELIYFI